MKLDIYSDNELKAMITTRKLEIGKIEKELSNRKMIGIGDKFRIRDIDNDPYINDDEVYMLTITRPQKYGIICIDDGNMWSFKPLELNKNNHISIDELNEYVNMGCRLSEYKIERIGGE